jgi:RimJ/RimL family protein N-acetyltransferase
MLTNLRKLLWLVSTGRLNVVVALLRRWLYSDATATGLARTLDTPLVARKPRQALTVRPMSPHEQDAFTDTRGASGEGALVRINARHLFDSGIQTCYVAVTEDGTPCYMQYLIGADQNDKLAEAFGELMPPLAPDEALLEFAFALEQYWNVGAMPAVVPELALKAQANGVSRLVTWVPDRNQQVLRYFERNGFTRFAIRKERYRLFRRTVRFEAARA